jgi:hypothetical protein
LESLAEPFCLGRSILPGSHSAVWRGWCGLTTATIQMKNSSDTTHKNYAELSGSLTMAAS